jgi:hypothetical protein
MSFLCLLMSLSPYLLPSFALLFSFSVFLFYLTFLSLFSLIILSLFDFVLLLLHFLLSFPLFYSLPVSSFISSFLSFLLSTHFLLVSLLSLSSYPYYHSPSFYVSLSLVSFSKTVCLPSFSKTVCLPDRFHLIKEPCTLFSVHIKVTVCLQLALGRVC